MSVSVERDEVGYVVKEHEIVLTRLPDVFLKARGVSTSPEAITAAFSEAFSGFFPTYTEVAVSQKTGTTKTIGPRSNIGSPDYHGRVNKAFVSIGIYPAATQEVA